MAAKDYMNANFSSELLLRDDRWGKQGFTGAKSVDGDTIPVLPVQYLESHDESRLMYNITSGQEWDESGGFSYRLGLHDQRWWKLQPYAIALMTCVGIPMLWAGQEFGENYGLPSDGFVRVRAARPLHWDYFYSPVSSVGGGTVLPLVQLYRDLGSIRRTHPALKGTRESCVLEVEDLARKILVFRRWEGSQIVLVAINFSDSDQQIEIPFGVAGTWKDLLKETHGGTDANETVIVSSASNLLTVTVPASYGRVYLFQ
jgi:1,4-alpha-glucan branching enzyme